MQQSSIERVLASTNLTLFFSLPFRPASRRNAFYNGHVAVGLEGQVYQVYNPQLLKSDFLFSVMPVGDWLFGEGKKWVERDPSSPKFRHVYLYKTCETRRTVVYAAGIRADKDAVASIRRRFDEEDERFRSGRTRYSFIRNNCSSIIANGLVRIGIVRPGLQNLIPALLFKRFAANPDLESIVRVGKVAAYEAGKFGLHRFCIGLMGLDPEKTMDRWVEKMAARKNREQTFTTKDCYS
ncbi:MAG TPA: hypothetical protein VKF42_07560 [Chitinivibrionales bacterium]|jgi:hypothetical protein|nr:hypothetical protein [Chitinivibrionales bacterium]